MERQDSLRSLVDKIERSTLCAFIDFALGYVSDVSFSQWLRLYQHELVDAYAGKTFLTKKGINFVRVAMAELDYNGVE